MMGCWTMEQQAALGMARALPAALYSSNDSLSANSRCLPFKAGQVNKISPGKSINKSLFTHWLIVLLLVLSLSLSTATSLSLSSSHCTYFPQSQHHHRLNIATLSHCAINFLLALTRTFASHMVST